MADWKDILGKLEMPDDNATDRTQAPIEKNNEKSSKTVTLFFEKKGRAGKSATILADFKGLNDNEIKELASSLKRTLGCGGSVSGGEILIQGDRRTDLRKILSERGFKVKGV